MTEVNQQYEFNKDMVAILSQPLSNQLLYIAPNSHTVLVNNQYTEFSNITLETVRSNILYGAYSNVCVLTSNQWLSYYDILPYETNLFNLGSASRTFESVWLKDIVFGTASCNIRIFKDSSQSNMTIQGASLYAEKIKIKNTNDYLPVGSILPFGGSVLPPGYLWCDGSEISKTVYASLYQVVQDMYGQSLNGNMFKVPDFRGRSPLGAHAMNPMFAMNAYYGSNYGGQETVTLNSSNLPSHQHIFNIATSGSAVTQGSYGMVQQIFTRPLVDTSKYIVYETDTIGTGTEPDITESSVSGLNITTNVTGVGVPFTCLHPVLVTNFIIKY